jgi:hypothetical protein
MEKRLQESVLPWQAVMKLSIKNVFFIEFKHHTTQRNELLTMSHK